MSEQPLTWRPRQMTARSRAFPPLLLQQTKKNRSVVVVASVALYLGTKKNHVATPQESTSFFDIKKKLWTLRRHSIN
jgi:hypothetical protein